MSNRICFRRKIKGKNPKVSTNTLKTLIDAKFVGDLAASGNLGFEV